MNKKRFLETFEDMNRAKGVDQDTLLDALKESFRLTFAKKIEDENKLDKKPVKVNQPVNRDKVVAKLPDALVRVDIDVKKAKIVPGCVFPAFTRNAPATTTSVRPVFRNKFMRGLLAAIVTEAFVSFSTIFLFAALKRSFSYSVLERALITRIPEEFSLTTRTIRSTAC